MLNSSFFGTARWLPHFFIWITYIPQEPGGKIYCLYPRRLTCVIVNSMSEFGRQVRATLRLLQDHMSGASYGVPRFHMERSWVNKVLPVSFRVWCFVAGSNKHGYLRRIIGAAENLTLCIRCRARDASYQPGSRPGM